MMRRLSDAVDRVLWGVGFDVSMGFLNNFDRSLAIKMQESGRLTNLTLHGTTRKPDEANGEEHAE